MSIPNGPEELETLPRYHALAPGMIQTTPDVSQIVRNELEKNGRVLWISNTVARARKVADLFSSIDPVVYHSRFIYKDRIERHNEVVALFEYKSNSGFASTSQVAEMSLDLKYATLLVTELAPISSLIQRFGRLARCVDEDEFRPGAFLVIEPMNGDLFSASPYHESELDLARAWLASLPNRPLSQRDLTDSWHALDNSSACKPLSSYWLTGGPVTLVDSIRESGFGVTVIRAEDLCEAKVNDVTAYTLPMERPRKGSWSEPYAYRGYPVASTGTIAYDPKRGGEWTTHFEF